MQVERSAGPFINEYHYGYQKHQDAQSVDAVHGAQERVIRFTFLFTEADV